MQNLFAINDISNFAFACNTYTPLSNKASNLTFYHFNKKKLNKTVYMPLRYTFTNMSCSVSIEKVKQINIVL